MYGKECAVLLELKQYEEDLAALRDALSDDAKEELRHREAPVAGAAFRGRDAAQAQQNALQDAQMKGRTSGFGALFGGQGRMFPL